MLTIAYPTAYRDPLLYNLNVTRELLKQVYVAERLQPPTSFSTLQSAYCTMWSRASNPAYWKEIAKTGELAKVGIYAVEAYGIFKVRFIRVFYESRVANAIVVDWGDPWPKESRWIQFELDLSRSHSHSAIQMIIHP